MPAVLWIGAVALVTGAYDVTTVLLVNNLVAEPGSWSTQWRFWFIEAAVGGVLVLALLSSVPWLGSIERRQPFAAALVVVAALLVLRIVAHGGVTAGPVERYQLIGVAWLFGLGWLAARASTARERIVVSIIVVGATAGYFGDPFREAVVVSGMLVLVWVRTVPLPRLMVPVVGVIAAASLFIYLVHWEVYPSLENETPLGATILSFASGIAVWFAWEFARRLRLGERGRRARAAEGRRGWQGPGPDAS